MSDDEYVVTQNSDGSYHIREAKSYEKSSYLVDTFTNMYRTRPSTTELAEATPNADTIASKQRWMSVSGVEQYKQDIHEVYSTFLDKYAQKPNYGYVGNESYTTCKNLSSYYLTHENFHTIYNRLKILAILGVMAFIISLAMAIIFLWEKAVLSGSLAFIGVGAGIIMLIPAIIMSLYTHNYKIKHVHKSFSKQSWYRKYKKYGEPELKKVLFNETQDEAYMELYSTEWTKNHIVPLKTSAKAGMDMYQWEILRRIEDKDYFDCTTNTTWALYHPDPSVYCYARSLTGYGVPAILPFKFKFDEGTKKRSVSTKEQNAHMANDALVSTCLLCYNWITNYNERLEKQELNFSCGDLYAHVQWLKRRLAEDTEFVDMLPKLKYSPHLADLLRNFDLDPPMDKPGIDTELGMSLDWYTAPEFQKKLEKNLYDDLVKRREEAANDMSAQGRFDNFDIYSEIKRK